MYQRVAYVTGSGQRVSCPRGGGYRGLVAPVGNVQRVGCPRGGGYRGLVAPVGNVQRVSCPRGGGYRGLVAPSRAAAASNRRKAALPYILFMTNEHKSL